MIARRVCLVLGIAFIVGAFAIPYLIIPPCWECCCYPPGLSAPFWAPIVFCLSIAASCFTAYFFWEDLPPC
jgi:hypothetical protein